MAAIAGLALSPAGAQTGAPADDRIVWHDLAKLPVEGNGWAQAGHSFDRLPPKAEGIVRPPVWNFARDSAGLRIRFVTDADSIRARWRLRKPDRLAMPHMPATGVSGLDLYTRDAGEWRWVAMGRPEKPDLNERVLVRGLDAKRREYLLYLPLYNGVETLEIGLPAGALFLPAPDRYGDRKPVVFYGTSITQGGCASRPGMAYPSIIGRSLDWPTVNLGFSGNGKSEPEMAALLAELDPAVYVLDSLGNLDVEQVGERVEPFIKTLREAHPTTPIVLLENVNYADTAFLGSRQAKVTQANAILRGIYDRLVAGGDKHLFYVPNFQLLGGDGEDTVDGTHPTDLGFVRMAEGIEPTVRTALAAGGFELAAESGFESLFDGKSLADWKVHQGMPQPHVGGKWWVENGVLAGTQDPPGHGGLLWLDRSFSDFILRLEFQVDYPVDSGVFLRVGPNGRSHQVTLDYRPGSDIGAIYIPFGRGYVQRNKEGIRALKENEWNRMEIRMEGEPSRIRVWLNDYLITDLQHTEASTEGVPSQGGIALQVHPDVGNLTLWKDGNSVRFRNIRIKELR